MLSSKPQRSKLGTCFLSSWSFSQEKCLIGAQLLIPFTHQMGSEPQVVILGTIWVEHITFPRQPAANGSQETV